MNSSSLNYVLTFRVRITPPSTDCVNKPSLNVFLKALDQPDVMDSMVVGLCILMAYTYICILDYEMGMGPYKCVWHAMIKFLWVIVVFPTNEY